MNWKEQWKRSRLVTVVTWTVGGIITLGTLAGAINSLFELADQDVFDGADGWFASNYIQLTGWLSTAVTLPVWSVLPVLAVAALVIARQHRQRSDIAASLASANAELASATAELEKLKSPADVALDAGDERILFWATVIYDNRATGAGPTPADIAKASGISLTEVEAALDVLKQKGLVRLKKLRSAPIDLTAEGRAYMAKREVVSRFVSFQFVADFNRI